MLLLLSDFLLTKYSIYCNVKKKSLKPMIMDLREYEEVFDIEISDTRIPEELRDFMELHGILFKYELPPLVLLNCKLGLKKITMRPSEIYLYIGQIVTQAAISNACSFGYACDLLNNPEKMPKSWNEYILVFETIFVDKNGVESFMYLDSSYGLKKLSFGFIPEGFITPPERSRFLCLVE